MSKLENTSGGWWLEAGQLRRVWAQHLAAEVTQPQPSSVLQRCSAAVDTGRSEYVGWCGVHGTGCDRGE